MEIFGEKRLNKKLSGKLIGFNTSSACADIDEIIRFDYNHINQKSICSLGISFGI